MLVEDVQKWYPIIYANLFFFKQASAGHILDNNSFRYFPLFYEELFLCISFLTYICLVDDISPLNDANSLKLGIHNSNKSQNNLVRPAKVVWSRSRSFWPPRVILIKLNYVFTTYVILIWNVKGIYSVYPDSFFMTCHFMNIFHYIIFVL